MYDSQNGKDRARSGLGASRRQDAGGSATISEFRVAILDDHRTFSGALRLALSVVPEIEVVGTAKSCREFTTLVAERKPNVLLLDYQLSDSTGVECGRRLRAEGTDARLLLLTAHASDFVADEAIRSGFERVLSKEAPLEELVDAVCHACPTFVPPRDDADFKPLSRRQREVLELMGQGLEPTAIAEQLFISVHTARSHIKEVLRKFDVSSQLAAVTKALREGYLLPPTMQDGGS